MEQKELFEKQKLNRSRNVVYVRLNDQEMNRLVKEASDHNNTLPTQIKDGYFNGLPSKLLFTREDADRIRGELRRIGNNVNQIARAINTGAREGMNGAFVEFQEAFKALENLVGGAYGHRQG